MRNGIACASGWSTSLPALRVASLASVGKAGILSNKSSGTFFSIASSSICALSACALRQAWYDLLPFAVFRDEVLFVFGKIVAHLVGDVVVLLGKPESLARGVAILCAAFAMRLVRPRDFRNAFADQGVSDDHLRFSVVAFFRGVERVEERLHVVALHFLHVEAVSAEAHAGVFALRDLRHRVERDVVASRR